MSPLARLCWCFTHSMAPFFFSFLQCVEGLEVGSWKGQPQRQIVRKSSSSTAGAPTLSPPVLLLTALNHREPRGTARTVLAVPYLFVRELACTGASPAQSTTADRAPPSSPQPSVLQYPVGPALSGTPPLAMKLTVFQSCFG